MSLWARQGPPYGICSATSRMITTCCPAIGSSSQQLSILRRGALHDAPPLIQVRTTRHRLSAFAFVLLSAVYKTMPVKHCTTFQIATASTGVAAIAATGLLLFLRLAAVYHGHRVVIGVFFALYLSAVAGSMTTPFAVTVERLGTTDYCVDTDMKPYAVLSAILPMVHDMLVFLAISSKLLCNSTRQVPTIRTRLRSFFSGKDLPAFSAALLRDGQAYYLITALSTLALVIMLCTTTLPIGYRGLLSVPTTFISNAMASRVFRHAKLELATRSSNLATFSTIQWQRQQTCGDPVQVSVSLPSPGVNNGDDSDKEGRHSSLDA